MWKTFYLEIAKVGLWNGLTITKAMLKSMLTNFIDEGVIPVTPDHIPDEWKSSRTYSKITNMELSEDGKVLKAEMQLKGWMLESWENGEFLKPSIEVQNHDQLGWLISTVALLGEQSPGIKGLKVNIEAFNDVYQKFVFCDNFNKTNINNENNNEEANMPVLTVEEIEKEVNDKLTLKFKDQTKASADKLIVSEKRAEKAEKELQTFKDEKKASDDLKVADDLKKFNEKVTEEAEKMKKFGYSETEITKFSEKYKDKVLFADFLADIIHTDQTANINERFEFSETGEKIKASDANDGGSIADILK